MKHLTRGITSDPTPAHFSQLAARIAAASAADVWSFLPASLRRISSSSFLRSASFCRSLSRYDAYRTVPSVSIAMKKIPSADRRIRIHRTPSISDLESLPRLVLIL